MAKGPHLITRRERISSEGLAAIRRKWYPGAFLGAACLIRDTQGLALLVRHRTAKGWRPGWSTPGGSPLPGEGPEECLRREVREEVALELRELRLVKVFDLVLTDGIETLRSRFYQFDALAEGEPKARHEVAEFRWFDILPGDMAYREDYLDVLPGREEVGKGVPSRSLVF